MKKEYVLVFLIKGRAKNYHKNLTREISNKFHIKNVGRSIAPHLTLKYLGHVEKEQIKEFERVIADFCKAKRKFNANLSGIGHFGKEVIFINVVQSSKIRDFYKRLYTKLTSLKEVPKFEFEGKNFHFHATLASYYPKRKFHKIYSYLSNQHPNYQVLLDKLVLMKKNKNKWNVCRIFKLRA